MPPKVDKKKLVNDEVHKMSMLVEKRMQDIPKNSPRLSAMIEVFRGFQRQLGEMIVTDQRVDLEFKLAEYIEILSEHLKLARANQGEPEERPAGESASKLGKTSIREAAADLLREEEPWMAFANLETRLRVLESSPSGATEQLNEMDRQLQRLPGLIKNLSTDPMVEGHSVQALFRDWMLDLREEWVGLAHRVQGSNLNSTVCSGAALEARPTLLIPNEAITSFDGSPSSWLAFRRDLQRLLEDRQYSNIIKFGQLAKATQSCPLARCIVERHSPCSDLAAACDELIRRYEEPTMLLRNLEQLIEKSEKLVEPNCQDWERFFLLVQQVDQQLALAKADSNTRLIVTAQLRKKLPQEARYVVRAEHRDFDKFKELVEQLWEAELSFPESRPEDSKVKNSRPVMRSESTRSKKDFRGRGVGAVGAMPKMSSGAGPQKTTPKALARDPHSACVFCPTDQHTSKDCPKPQRERQQRLFEQGICFRCMKDRYPNCKCEKKCPLCRRPHHLLLCRELERRSRSEVGANEARTSAGSGGSGPEPGVDLGRANPVPQYQIGAIQVVQPEMIKEMKGAPVRQMIRCYLMSQGRMEEVSVFIDPGAEVTLINPHLVERLSLAVTKVRGLVITGPGCGPKLCQQLTAFRLVDHSGSINTKVQAYLYSELHHVHVPAPPPKLVALARRLGIHLSVQKTSTVVPDIIVGVDYLDRESFAATDWRRLTPSIMAFRLPIGWALRGFYEDESSNPSRSIASYSAMPHECPCEYLKTIFGSTDEALRTDVSSVEVSFDRKEHRFVVKLPWISDQRPTNNFGNARGQVLALRRRLEEQDILLTYHQAISEFLEADYAEVATPRFLEDSYYLPHRPVVKPDAVKTKVRPVFNGAAAVRGGYSLNRCLARGMPINCDLFLSLVNFRCARIPLVSDVVKAFLQIRIAPVDRNYLRFFWFRHLEDSEPCVYRLKSLLFGANCSPHVLGAVLEQLFAEGRARFPVLEQCHETIYMDDIVLDVDKVELAESAMSQLVELLSSASFSLHDWSTSEEIRRQLPHLPFHPFAEEETTKCLGVSWLPHSDRLICEAKFHPPTHLTRRSVSSFLAKLYDPLDLLLPFKIKVRLFCRDLCKKKAEWDSPLPTEHEERFRSLATEYRALKSEVPRSTGAPLSQLMIFTDASPQAYGAVAYVVDVNGNWVLLCAKGSLTPMRRSESEEEVTSESPTIPRLELCAAVVGAELYARLTQAPRLKSLPCLIFCDSQVTLYRIFNESRLHTEAYVQNRLDKIRRLTSKRVEWRYVVTSNNPADVLTHPMDVDVLIRCSIWWNGPDLEALEADHRLFIQAKGTTNCEQEQSIGDALAVAEAAPTRSCDAMNAVTGPATVPLSSKDHWTRILALGYEEALQELLVLSRSRRKTMEMRNSGKVVHHSEESYLRIKLWRAVQRVVFTKDYDALVQGKRPRDYRLRNCQAHVDEWKVIRWDRNISHMFPYAVRFPIVLSAHPLLISFILREHVRLLHPGTNTMNGHMSSEFKIFGGFRLIESLIRKCRDCRRARGPAFSAPVAPLPFDRVTEAETPFTSVGLDYFGPVVLVGRRKVYGLLFSCSRIRAVHLEPVTSLAVTNCILAIQRFVARRGIPEQVRSDNATTFHAANEILVRLVKNVEEASRDPQISRYQIRWMFNAPRAPWWGGAFERIIGTVKSKLAHVDWRHRLTLEGIWTVFAEIEAVVNSRPLVGQDSREPPLTPAHFLVGKKLTSLPGSPSLPHPEPVLDQYYKIKELVGLFRQRWSQEYLNTLVRERRKLPNARAPEVGETVLIQDASKPRRQWPLGCITKVYPGVDGVVRLVDVRTSKGNILQRAVQCIIPLEASPVGPRPPRECVALHCRQAL